ncbi:MAG: hypothetical protein EA393_16640 [Bacteroidetes bacterium]|nr:MAG: hypothetical protein EA393_16640 [Bacteroidota bacterium]
MVLPQERDYIMQAFQKAKNPFLNAAFSELTGVISGLGRRIFYKPLSKKDRGFFVRVIPGRVPHKAGSLRCSTFTASKALVKAHTQTICRPALRGIPSCSTFTSADAL